jgi:hypothetical protein
MAEFEVSHVLVGEPDSVGLLTMAGGEVAVAVQS